MCTCSTRFAFIQPLYETGNPIIGATNPLELLNLGRTLVSSRKRPYNSPTYVLFQLASDTLLVVDSRKLRDENSYDPYKTVSPATSRLRPNAEYRRKPSHCRNTRYCLIKNVYCCCHGCWRQNQTWIRRNVWIASSDRHRHDNGYNDCAPFLSDR